MMGTRPALRYVLIVLVTVVVVAGGVALSGQVGAQRSGLARALELLPQDTRSVGYTDWNRVGDVVDVEATSPASREEFDAQARERDLTTRSVLAGRSQDLYAGFGWSLDDLDWDAYGQSRTGSVVVIGLGADLSASSVVESLRQAGYEKSSDIWHASSDEFRRAHPDIPDELNNVAVVNERTLLASTRAGVLQEMRDTSRTAAANRDLSRTADEVRGATAVLLQDGDLACDSAGFDDADPSALEAVRAAERRSGQLGTYRALARAIDGDRHTMTFAMAFDSPAAASQQIQVRRDLSSGPFIGRGGQIEEALVLQNARTDEDTGVLRFRHDVETDAFMAAVGPVIFASCAPPH